MTSKISNSSTGNSVVSSIRIEIHAAPDTSDLDLAASLRSVDEVFEVSNDLTVKSVDKRSLTLTQRVLSPNQSSPRSELHPDFVVLMAAGCELDPYFVEVLFNTVRAQPEVDFFYFDSYGPVALRPGFSPERLADQMYLGPVVALGRELVAEYYESNATHGSLGAPLSVEQAVELTDRSRRIAHIPQVLYRTGGQNVEASNSPPVAVGPVVDLVQASAPLASVIIATNGATRVLAGREELLVAQAVRSVIDASTYPNVEIVVVLTPGSPPSLSAEIESLTSLWPAASYDGGRRALRTVVDDRPFNFSNACNRGVFESTGDLLVFLNDDTKVRSTDWLEQLAAHAMKPDVGAVGARLLYEDETVQHQGIWCRGGHPVHRAEGMGPNEAGYLGALGVAQNCLAVTGAVLAVERTKFLSVGGFSPLFPSSYNDVDLCLKLLARNLRTVVEPAAELFHFEASSRNPTISQTEIDLLHQRWRHILNQDPYDNPNFSAPLSEELPLPSAESLLGVRGSIRVWPLSPIGDVDLVEASPQTSETEADRIWKEMLSSGTCDRLVGLGS